MIYYRLISRRKKIYQWILAGIEISSLGMAFTFPFYGYNAVSIFFSTLYIVVTVVFAPVFIKDVVKSNHHKTVRLLSISAVICLIVSFLGALGLVYILMSKSSNSILYRDSIYTFLHFQYNGFFTLSVFALVFSYVLKKDLRLQGMLFYFPFFSVFPLFPPCFFPYYGTIMIGFIFLQLWDVSLFW